MRLVMLTIFLLVLAATAIWLVGATRWRALTGELRQGLRPSSPNPSAATCVEFAELEGLPAPVQRFFRAVLEEGHPLIAGVNLQHTGTFNMAESGEQWRAFTSDQVVVTRPPGFDWDARISMMPLVPVRVHDAYVSGEGVLRAAVFGAFTVADIRGRGEIARGELTRFLAETAWYPTALLPSQGVQWAPLDDRSALATLTDGDIALTMRFTFHPEGPIDTVYADARARAVGKSFVPTPWQGRFWNYQWVDGVRVPLDGEVAWVLPEGPRPYWRGHIDSITFSR